MVRSLLAAFALLFALNVHATPNSVQICTNGSMAGHVAQDCILSLKWDIPKTTDLVLTRPPTSTEQWGNTTTWQALNTVNPPTQIRLCPLDLSLPANHGNGVPDPCGQSQVWVTAPTGADVHITCTAPTTNTNGTTIAGNQLPLGFYFWEGQMPGPVYRQVSPKTSACDYTFKNLEPGNHYFAAITEDATGAQSGSSNEATKTVPAPNQGIPNPPTDVAAPGQVLLMSDNRVFTMKQTQNQISFTQVGTLPVSTACDSTQPVLDKFVVPRGGVSWLGNVKPQVVFGLCQWQ